VLDLYVAVVSHFKAGYTTASCTTLSSVFYSTFLVLNRQRHRIKGKKVAFFNDEPVLEKTHTGTDTISAKGENLQKIR
jgi:hypothetical protein